MTGYESPDQARLDALCRPMTMAEVMRATGRTRRTIDRWVEHGELTKYELEHPREIVFNARDVAETEKRMRDAAQENKDRIRRRGGRPGPRKAVPLDTSASDDRGS